MANPDSTRLFLLLLGIAVNTSVVQSTEEELRLPALGQYSELGQLYDARYGHFRPVNVFKTTELPNEALRIWNISKVAIDSTTSNSFKNRAKLLNIDGNTAANILSGLTKPDGAAAVLQNTQSSQTEVSGVLLFKYQTVQENLQIFNKELKELYDEEVLLRGDATHVLTGIKWGANIALTVKGTAGSTESRQDLISALESTLKIIKSAEAVPSESFSNFTMSFIADIALPFLESTNHRQVKEMLSQIPLIIEGTEGGKGAPIEFTLTPLGLIKEHHQITEAPSVTHKIDEWILQKFIDIYDDIYAVDQQLNDLSSPISSNAICTTLETKADMSQLLSDFEATKLKFTEDFNSKLVDVRSGQLPATALSNMVQAYDENKFNSKNVRTELVKFDVALQKIKLYNVFKNSDLPIEYFGSNNDFTTRVQENLESVIYVLFQSPEFTQKNPKAFTSNLNTFLTTLSKPFNTRFVVDCDFGHPECSTMNETTIKQIFKGQTTSKDVNFEMQKASAAKLLNIKAIGRFAQIGELFDVRTDEFTGRSILNSKSSEDDNFILKTLTAPSFETIIVSSRRYQDKFKALNIDPQQQFTILINTAPLTRSGLYLSPEEDDKEIASIVNIRRLSESELKINDDAFLSSLDFNVALKPSATHFVSKIEYGFNTIFSIKDDDTRPINATKLQDYLDSLESTILQFNLNFNMNDLNATTQLEYKHTLQELPSNWKIKIFSDSQGIEEKPTVIKTNEELMDYLNTSWMHQQSVQNFGKGQPIAYVMEPIQNLRDKGVLGESVPFGMIATSNYECGLFQQILGDVRKAKSQMKMISKEMEENPDCVTDHDVQVLKEIERHFESRLASVIIRLKTLVKQIWTGEVGSSKLIRLAQDCTRDTFFSGDGRYNQLHKLTPFEQKLHLYKQIKRSSIKYLGRNNSETYFSFVLDTNGKGFRYYLLYYKPEWVRQKTDVWRRTSHVFFNSLANGKGSSSNNKLYLVDCDFWHSKCEGMTQPAIHVYKEGKLISSDFVLEIEEDEKAGPKMSHEMKTLLEDIESKIVSVTDNLAAVKTEVTKSKSDIKAVSAKLEAEVTRNRNNINGQQTGLGAVNRTAIQNQGYIRNLTATLATVETEVMKIKEDIKQADAATAKLETEVTKNRNNISAQQTGLDTVNRTEIQNRNPIRVLHPCEGEKPAFIANATTSSSFGCGGTIQLPSKGESIVMDFNLPSTKGSLQRCLWTMDASQSNKHVNFKVKLTLLCKHPPQLLDDNTLTFSEWYGHAKELTTNRISSSSHNSFLLSNNKNYRGFLSFNANKMDSEAGFILQVDVLDATVHPGSSSSATHTESVGSASLSLPSSYDLSSIVINLQPAAKMTLTVDVDSSDTVNPCESWNSIDILEFGMDGVPKQLGRLCGRNSVTSYKTENPVVALFNWQAGKSGRGVKLSWK